MVYFALSLVIYVSTNLSITAFLEAVKAAVVVLGFSFSGVGLTISFSTSSVEEVILITFTFEQYLCLFFSHCVIAQTL